MRGVLLCTTNRKNDALVVSGVARRRGVVDVTNEQGLIKVATDIVSTNYTFDNNVVVHLGVEV